MIRLPPRDPPPLSRPAPISWWLVGLAACFTIALFLEALVFVIKSTLRSS